MRPWGPGASARVAGAGRRPLSSDRLPGWACVCGWTCVLGTVFEQAEIIVARRYFFNILAERVHM